jgi:hypothetical protein
LIATRLWLASDIGLTIGPLDDHLKLVGTPQPLDPESAIPAPELELELVLEDEPDPELELAPIPELPPDPEPDAELDPEPLELAPVISAPESEAAPASCSELELAAPPELEPALEPECAPPTPLPDDEHAAMHATRTVTSRREPFPREKRSTVTHASASLNGRRPASAFHGTVPWPSISSHDGTFQLTVPAPLQSRSDMACSLPP